METEIKYIQKEREREKEINGDREIKKEKMRDKIDRYEKKIKKKNIDR